MSGSLDAVGAPVSTFGSDGHGEHARFAKDLAQAEAISITRSTRAADDRTAALNQCRIDYHP